MTGVANSDGLQVINPLATSLFGDCPDDTAHTDIVETIATLVLEEVPDKERVTHVRAAVEDVTATICDKKKQHVKKAQSASKRQRTTIPAPTTDDTTPPTMDNAPPVEQKPVAPLSARNGYQEMRAFGHDIRDDVVLSDGESVGEFLLRQWLTKEKSKR